MNEIKLIYCSRSVKKFYIVDIKLYNDAQLLVVFNKTKFRTSYQTEILYLYDST